MGIIIENNLISLCTARQLYQMKVAEGNVLLHLYYGKRTGCDMSYLIRTADRGFSANPYEMQDRRGFSLDTLPQEYPGSGVGDYRTGAVRTLSANGSRSTDLRYAGHSVTDGRQPLPGLPFVRGTADCQTLTVTLRDPAIGLRVELFYHVFPELDVITRSVRLTNEGSSALTLEKAASLCLDFPHGSLDVIHFHGRHCMERVPERLRLPRGTAAFGSTRGMSSHQHNPFVILCDPRATEDAGDCWGVMLMYSGSHLQEIEVNQVSSTRLVSGIHPDGFAWQLQPGESFDTPEAILAFSGEGLNGLSRLFHRVIREQVIHPRYKKTDRPVLINSWEAAYFDFDAEKILRFAASAKELGVEMLVLDDGWFGVRNDDTTSLGDWCVNERKLGCSMKELSDRIHALGLKFGLWFEPEMISENSALFRAHPDWALTDPDRKPAVGRSQLVLDMSRQDVVDYVFGSMCAVLDHARIEYVKWDFNRSIANVYSHALPASRQGEVAHRFMLGTYGLLSRLLDRYPDLLIEGCSGGGGRFDAGMLFFCPQIWCSDDTDAIERLEIQRGTSYGYPVSTMGAHVSAMPNHQTGRCVPLGTRGIVAQSGTFGYELNPENLTPEERSAVQAQIADYRRYASLVSGGVYYRLTEIGSGADYEAWMFVSPDGCEALVNTVVTHQRANGPFVHIRLRGLKADAVYCLEETGERFTGAALMEGGYAFPPFWGDYPSQQLHLVCETPAGTEAVR